MRRLLFFTFAVLLASPALEGYSVLTHEAIIDAAWDSSIKPLLLKRFPRATPDELRDAHAHAYGGCIIQDMGYYPFGSKFFSDLLHYVRTGDFILNLLDEASDLNEYAFALGTLEHYAADTDGHPIAVNRAVALEYPKLRRKYGDLVTYADNPSAHIKVEFGFDVLQVARGNYAAEAYHDFIGFQVAKPALERAFRRTYDLELKDVFTSVDLAIGTYRHAVATVIPEMTKVAWEQKKDELTKAMPGITRAKFVYYLSKASYQKEWDNRYKKPGIGARILAFLLRIIPKVGPFKAIDFKPPTAQTSTLFQDSFDKTMDIYCGHLASSARGDLSLPNRDFDTGKPTRPGEYKLADKTYSKLAIKLAEKDGPIDNGVRGDVLAFFSDPDLPYATKKDHKEWRKTLDALARLKAQSSVAAGRGRN